VSPRTTRAIPTRNSIRSFRCGHPQALPTCWRFFPTTSASVPPPRSADRARRRSSRSLLQMD
jgi:hypothetical protein